MNILEYKTLEEFEGPILQQVITADGKIYVRKWCSHYHFLFTPTTSARIKAFLSKRITMLDLMAEFNTKGILQDIRDQSFTEVDLNSLPELYLPKEGCFHDYDLGVKNDG